MSVAAHRFSNSLRRRPEGDDAQVHLTPSYVLDPLREAMIGIGLDPCTEPHNPTRADKFYCLPRDGCALPWNANSVFCNPPYGEARERWVRRCIAEGEWRRVALLIPAATDTRIFHEALAACDAVLLVKARLRFGVKRENGRQKAASHGSAIFGWGFDMSPLSNLGTILARA